MSSPSQIKDNLVFTCKHEQFPETSVDSDKLFKYARWLEKNNQLRQEEAIYAQIERLYRIALESGHYKANINLQNGALRGHYQLGREEHLRMSQQLIDAEVATGHFFIGYFLQRAVALKNDPEMALRYYRKAADEGNAEAQYYIAEKLAPSDIAPDIARQMHRCAAEQGHGKAAVALGVNLKGLGQYQDALKIFQLGVAAGHESAASRLSAAFRDPKPNNIIHYLGQQKDDERADRYKKIWRILANYSYANPKVPEINEIVPLPPAKLPPWDGKLQWLEERLANVPPPKPSETLIGELAKAKRLDPATGKPMPGAAGFNQSHLLPLNSSAHSGEACPVSGYWKINWHYMPKSVWSEEVVRYFEQGQIMPTHNVKHRYPRPWPFTDKIIRREQAVRWMLA
ncbi:sel1 repeat family protein [Pseudomonas sp. NPDC090755]|uniref:SEL1-like repeat protein n=1 Tax=Pseudomonas sp. NPDC090755 TaxID=3364481 RepID=UPI00383BCF95